MMKNRNPKSLHKGLNENLIQEWAAESNPQSLLNSLLKLKSDAQLAVTELNKHLDLGSPLAGMYLGEAYIYGYYGLEKDVKLGIALLKNAYKRGSTEATFLLALYFEGVRDKTNSVTYYHELKRRSYSPAIYRIALNYYHGELYERNLEKSITNFELSAKLGHIYSMRWLAWLYFKNNFGLYGKLLGTRYYIKQIFLYTYYRIFYPDSDKMRMY